jgi:hypothetical protein
LKEEEKKRLEEERKILEAKVAEQEREKAEKQRREEEEKRLKEEQKALLNAPVSGCGPEARATLRTRQKERRRMRELEVQEAQRQAEEREKAAQVLLQKREQALLEMESMFEDTAQTNAILIAQEKEAEKKRIKQEQDERINRQQATAAAHLPVPQKKASIVSPVSSPSASPRLSEETTQLAKLKAEKVKVEVMLQNMETELKEVAAKKLLRSQYRMEVMEESLNAMVQQRQAIRLEARQVTLLAKKSVRTAGRLHSFFVENIKDLTSNCKTFLTMVAILVNQTQFKSLGSKLHVFASNFQRELGSVIQNLKKEHIRLTKEKAQNGGDLSMLSGFAGIIGSILSVTNEIISTHEHSSAVLKSQPDPMDSIDAAKSAEILTKVTKAHRVIQLLGERIQSLETQVIAKPKSNRRQSTNPSRRN